MRYGNSVDILDQQNKLEILNNWLKDENVIYDSQIFTKMIKRDVFKESYFEVPDDLSSGEDYIAFLYYLQNGKLAASIDKVFYHYNVRNNSISHTRGGIENLLLAEKLTHKMIEIIKNMFFNVDLDIFQNWIMKRKGYALVENLPYYAENLLIYHLENIETLFHKKVILYGAGKVGKDLYKQLMMYEQIEVVDWIDKYPQNVRVTYRAVNDLKVINTCEYDYIVVAILSESVVKDVYQDLLQLGVEQQKIIWYNYPAFGPSDGSFR